MKAEELRAIQAPLKTRYREAPETAVITLKAQGSLDGDGITCSGRIFYRGTVNGSTTSGTTSGDGVCNQNGNLADVTLNGSYVASRQQ